MKTSPNDSRPELPRWIRRWFPLVVALLLLVLAWSTYKIGFAEAGAEAARHGDPAKIEEEIAPANPLPAALERPERMPAWAAPDAILHVQSLDEAFRSPRLVLGHAPAKAPDPLRSEGTKLEAVGYGSGGVALIETIEE